MPPPSVVLGAGIGAQQARTVVAWRVVRSVAVGHLLQQIVVVGDGLDRYRIADLPGCRTGSPAMKRLLIWLGAVNWAAGSAASSSTGDVPGPFSTELPNRTLKCSSPVLPRQPTSP